MGINKVQYGDTVLIDLTDTTATANDVVSGSYFYDSSGTRTLGTAVIPTKLSDLTNDMDVSDFPNDAGYLTSYTETDPTVPSWAKQASKPSYSASEISGLLDFFYPVGSYYETSDGTFDPNVEWGGTWSLETAGQVHVSAGTGYTLGAVGGDISVTVPTTTLTDAQMAHGHGFTQPNVTGGWTSAAITGGSHAHKINTHNNSGTGSVYPFEVTSTAQKQVSNTDRIASSTHTHDLPSHTHTVSGGAVSNLSGASSTRTAHGHGSVSTMQPYIVVNRWHRTA